jgi:hypothetical protein
VCVCVCTYVCVRAYVCVRNGVFFLLLLISHLCVINGLLTFMCVFCVLASTFFRTAVIRNTEF